MDGTKPTPFLAELKDFVRPSEKFTFSVEDLETFFSRHKKSTVYQSKDSELYQSPLVIIPQSPGDNDVGARAYISDQPIAFSQSFYGYSCAGHPESETLAALIYLLPHSTFFAYFCLMTSRRGGFDRQTFNKQEFDSMPFPDLAKLPSKIKATLRNLTQRLQHDSRKPWQEINEFIFRLYGLDADAVQITEDTLFSAASYRRAGKAALDRTTRETRSDFLETLRENLNPYFDVCGESVEVLEPEKQPGEWREPWFFLTVSRTSTEVPFNPSLLREAMKVANQRGSSRIIVQASGKRGLLIGLLNQRRWWTKTRARLCAQHIIRQHLAAFGLPETA